MMWMPERSVRMKRLTFGFHRRVWCPKCTPLSSSWRMVTTAMAVLLLCRHGEAGLHILSCLPRPVGRDPWCPDAIPHTVSGGTDGMAATRWAREVTPRGKCDHQCSSAGLCAARAQVYGDHRPGSPAAP